MAVAVNKFVNSCQEIVDAKPQYQKGCSNKKMCDCIGMIKYGLKQNGLVLKTTGTNFTFRNQVENIRRITGITDLRIGDVVFRALDPGASNYRLPEKYKQGGSEYNGDLKDYNHIGVVKSVHPLQIIHMTGPTAKTDTAIGKWKYAAQMKARYIDYGAAAQVPVKPTTDVPATDSTTAQTIITATVEADNGKPVKLREKPSTRCKNYDELPVGTVVTVLVYKDDWCTVTYRNRKGWYMMTKFLSFG